MARRLDLVDVFGREPLTGNPLAVVHDAGGLSTEEMQQITRWLNLSETAFLLPPTTPEADYRVRIFTLAGELPFAGHPTLGSCHAWLSAGHRQGSEGMVVQECGVGLVSIRTADRLAFSAPPLLRQGPVDDSLMDEVIAVLGADPESVLDAGWVDNGPGWLGVLLDDADTVLALDPDFSRFAGDGTVEIGVVGPCPPGSETAFEVRAFFADQHGGMVEDPVTGSLNASLAQWLLARGTAAAPYVAGQGTRLGRSGRVHIDADPDGTVWVGGNTTTVVTGELV